MHSVGFEPRAGCRDCGNWPEGLSYLWILTVVVRHHDPPDHLCDMPDDYRPNVLAHEGDADGYDWCR